MYLIITSSRDAYITNKILSNKFRATDANTGRAGTLDLFKLYSEATISGETNPIELSRALIKFDFDKLIEMTGSILDVNHSSFKCSLKMKALRAGQVTPQNFRLSVFPLSQSFDEGIGRDVGSYGDLDACNFITASYSNGAVIPWKSTGAAAEGLLGSSDIDIISSGNLNDGSGVQDLFQVQVFQDGNEDLNVDVTTVVSGILAGMIPNHGFRLSFSGTEETDTKTRFVKRFFSRHSRQIYKQPMIHVSFDDTIHDHHQGFFFDVSGSIFLNNFHRGSPSNIVSGSALTDLTGDDCLAVTIMSGSFSKVVTASQHVASTTPSAGLPGVYSASFAIPMSETSTVISTDRVTDFAIKSGSLTFDEIWHSLDGTVAFYSGSLTLSAPTRTASNFTSRKPDVIITNAKGDYTRGDKVKFRVFARDHEAERTAPTKRSYELKSVMLEEVYYRVRDVLSGDVAIPFQKTGNGTRLSTDSAGMYFEFHMSNLFIGRVYSFEFLIVDRGQEYVIDDLALRFRVDP